METLNVERPSQNLPAFILAQLNSRKDGRAALAFYDEHGYFPDPKTVKADPKPRRVVPEGFKYCPDCGREVGETLAMLPLEMFSKVGVDDDGNQKYGVYCKSHTADRAAAYAAKTKEKRRLVYLTETAIPNAEQKLADLKAEAELLTNKQALAEVEPENDEVN